MPVLTLHNCKSRYLVLSNRDCIISSSYCLQPKVKTTKFPVQPQSDIITSQRHFEQRNIRCHNWPTNTSDVISLRNSEFSKEGCLKIFQMEFQFLQIYTKTCIKAQDVHLYFQCVLRREQQIRQIGRAHVWTPVTL